MYILIPALVFRIFYETDFQWEHGSLVIYVFVFMFLMIFLTKFYAKLMKLDTDTESGLILSTTFMNSGNYGLPIVLFAFGNDAAAIAVIFMVMQSFLMTTFGVYYATKGSKNIGEGLKSIFKLPTIYAVLIALLCNFLNIHVPSSLFQIIDFIAGAAIPVSMIILGMQLAEISLKKLQWRLISFSVVIRLILSPFIAWGLTSFFQMTPLMQSVAILLSSTPTAATITMYSIQFNSKPQLVSSVTLFSTLLSVITISILLTIIGG